MTLPRRCLACGSNAPPGEAWRCACGGPWALEPYGRVPPLGVLRERPPGLWRYREALPVEGTPVTLGEGGTPVVPARDGRLHFKVESANPTGSFKDRGAAVLLTDVATSGARTLVEDSSGNAGAAIAAYAARAGLEATIYVPEAASPGKLAQVAAYGARLVRVPGSREAVAAAATCRARALRESLLGSRLLPRHEDDRLRAVGGARRSGAGPGRRRPSATARCCSGSGSASGSSCGAGAIPRAPRLLAVQSAACAPLAGPALGRGAGTGDTVAEGIRVRQPVRPDEIRRAVDESGGRFLVVEDAEIRAARARLAREGLFVEPTAAVAPAAAWRLVDAGAFASSDMVVVPLTGHGLKAPTAP